MYLYDPIDREFLTDRSNEFRHQVARRLAGELTEDQFKPLRLMNGLYLQLHAYMLRIAIPYGSLNARQARRLAWIARTYDKGYGHMTTRQNIQFNWIKLKDAPDILDALAEVDLHAIQTSGNCIRNVTADPYAGATAEEVDDPRVWSEVLRQWSTLHPEFSFLPRKFKIAITGALTDRAAVKVHDIGLILRKGRDGAIGFEVIVGGGQGRTPYVGPTIKSYLPSEHLLSYVEAILRVYNRHGRRDNIYKARIKILVAALGAEEFARQVEEEWGKIDHARANLPASELARVRAAFAQTNFETLPDVSEAFEAARAASPALQRFVRNNVKPHKQPGYAIVEVSLKAIGQTPGDATAEQLDVVADLAERYSLDDLRVTHAQNLVLPHVRLDDLPTVHAALEAAGLATANIDLASDIIACPGLDYCALANARAIPIAQDIARKFEEFYQLSLGGSGAEDASIGRILGPGLSADKVAPAIDALVDAYLNIRAGDERFLDTYRRVGLEPFKEAVYAQAD
jgi:sulfite reductase (NADPH) hemoprotein beta-component